MSSPILQVEGLTIVAGQGTIVSNLSFQISAGEIVALTGKSGSGKSSIAMAILGLLPPGLTVTGGVIKWSSGDMSKSLPVDRDAWHELRGTQIGFTQQDAFGAFDPVLQMGQQMLMILRERTLIAGIQQELELRKKMEEVGLHDIPRLWTSYPHQLSGGQLQRCQLAMTMVIKPALLITDEPTSAIDKINQLGLLDVFIKLKTDYNMAILCITHEEAIVQYLADREVQLDAITWNFALPELKNFVPLTVQHPPVLEVSELQYTHAFGGMMYRKGASVGKISFSLQKGSCLGVVGESGSGKSTLAQLMVGLLMPSGGHIILEGKPIDFRHVNDIKRLRSKVQLVMQDGRGSLHPYFPIQKLMMEIVFLRQELDPGYNPDLDILLKEVGLFPEVLERTAGQLSGGECLRISIARALMMDPDVLICDESTSALDGANRDAIVDLLLKLKIRRKLAVLFVSHDERVIRGIADEVMILAGGQVVEKGMANDVIRFPTHPVTRKIFTPDATLEQKGRL